MIDYEKLQKSLRHLALQYANYRRAQERVELTDIDREAIAESVMQRFETCYDTLWKDLKRYLVEALGLADVPASPKPVLRIAAQNGLLAGSVEQWLAYANARTNSAHDYSGAKAAETLALVGTFLGDAKALYQKMSGTVWQ